MKPYKINVAVPTSQLDTLGQILVSSSYGEGVVTVELGNLSPSLATSLEESLKHWGLVPRVEQEERSTTTLEMGK